MLIGDSSPMFQCAGDFLATLGDEAPLSIGSTRGCDEDPDVVFNAPVERQIDDAVIAAMLGRARAAGTDAWVVPQPPHLPMANRREDILLRRP